MPAFRWFSIAAALGVAVLCLSAPVARAESDAIQDILDVLREKGLIDEETEQRILLKSQTDPNPHVASGPMKTMKEHLEWTGDLRIRNEQFWYSDSFGTERDDRNRWRYRLRIGFKTRITDWAQVGIRLATGSSYNSTNQTLGDSDRFRDTEFGVDPISVNQAWVKFTLPEPLAIDLKPSFTIGKISNPFTWKHGKDWLLWDRDITPEGMNLHAGWDLSEHARVFGNIAYFIIDERSSNSDVKLVAYQLGSEFDVGFADLGLRGSWYDYRSLDDSFEERSVDTGNLPGAFDGGKARVGEIAAYSRFGMWERWPLLLYGSLIQNFEAESTTIAGVGSAGKENDAWGLGFEFGSPKEWFLFGGGYFYVEANSVMSLVTDSDIFDARTNREGYALYLARNLSERIQLKFTFFDGEEIDDDDVFNLVGTPGADPAGDGSNRRRLQSDLSFRF
jgi:hypothetical protein